MTRDLDWHACENVRDLGGLVTVSGRPTRSGIVVRADDLAKLSEAGWRAVVAQGATRVVDLRFPEERESQPYEAPVEVTAVSLFGRRDGAIEEGWERRAREMETTAMVLAETYTQVVTECGGHVRDAVRAVAETPGTVIVHCVAGKDRTGIVSALCLRIAGVPNEVVAADYAASEPGVRAMNARWVAAAESEEERRRRARFAECPAEAMSTVLAFIDAEWGGVDGYLREVGVDREALENLRQRLTGVHP